jgi:translation initiation factor IF-2
VSGGHSGTGSGWGTERSDPRRPTRVPRPPASRDRTDPTAQSSRSPSAGGRRSPPWARRPVPLAAATSGRPRPIDAQSPEPRTRSPDPRGPGRPKWVGPAGRPRAAVMGRTNQPPPGRCKNRIDPAPPHRGDGSPAAPRSAGPGGAGPSRKLTAVPGVPRAGRENPGPGNRPPSPSPRSPLLPGGRVVGYAWRRPPPDPPPGSVMVRGGRPAKRASPAVPLETAAMEAPGLSRPLGAGSGAGIPARVRPPQLGPPRLKTEVL